jgi:hypothetical protein
VSVDVAVPMFAARLVEAAALRDDDRLQQALEDLREGAVAPFAVMVYLIRYAGLLTREYPDWETNLAAWMSALEIQGLDTPADLTD